MMPISSYGQENTQESQVDSRGRKWAKRAGALVLTGAVVALGADTVDNFRDYSKDHPPTSSYEEVKHDLLDDNGATQPQQDLPARELGAAPVEDELG